MRANQFINTEKIFTNVFDFEDADQYIIRNQQENFYEDEKLLFNIQNEGFPTNPNNSLDLPNNNKTHCSSIKTNATVGELSQKGNFSFFSFGDEQNQNLNIIQKKKELTKESIETLNNFISKEKLVVSNVNNIFENKCYNIGNNNSIKDIKNNIFSLDNKLSMYFKKPYMRKNIKKKKNIIKHYNYYGEQDEEDEKIKFDDIKMDNLKDDDSKTNNDSCDDMNPILDKKKSQ